MSEAPDYKDTLNLPQTDFPMRAGLPTREPAWLERWQRLNVYDTLRENAKKANAKSAGKTTDKKTKPRPDFVLHDGPPYANGHLHIGHALNKILKDFIHRSQQMLGHDSRYVPGWDCHGLPIEWKIEEQYRNKGKDKDDVAPIELRKECRRFAAEWVDIQRAEFQRMGVSGKWDAPYLTMDYQAEATIAAEFLKFVMNGALYQGSKPVMWSPVEKTALAEAEVEYDTVQSPTIWVAFALKNWGEAARSHPHFDALKTARAVIWTTTPWTIPANRGMAYHRDISYGLYAVKATADECWAHVGEHYILADKLAQGVLESARVQEFTRVCDVPTALFDGVSCRHPFADLDAFWDYESPLFDGEFVTEEVGTGLVHCAPSHGPDEYEVFAKNGWLARMTHHIGEQSEFLPHVPFFADLRVFNDKGKAGKANAAVMDKLIEAGALIARGRIEHSYPHSWRSKAPLIFRNTPQWFIAIDYELGGDNTHGKTIRERALREIDNVKWTPQTGRNRLHSMIKSRPDWVLSRQRAWGVPLCCFIRKDALPTDAGFILQNDEVNARIVDAFTKESADCWYEDGAKTRFLGGIDGINPDEWEQVFDILDVWFDSGSTHAFVLRDRADGAKDGIADLYLEGTDQHRGWFHSSLLQSCGTNGRAPYRGVLTHGFTLDEKGHKMSKSLGNTMVPDKIIQQYGADILRLWVAQTDYTADQRIGAEILKNTADSYRRLRNTFRFILGNLADWDNDKNNKPVKFDDMPELEKYILHLLAKLDKEVCKDYEAYNFQRVFQKIFHFCTVDLSAFYFDIRKDALYCDAKDSLNRRAACTVLDILFDHLTRWLAPILCFTMDEIWRERNKDEDACVHLQDFLRAPTEWLDEHLNEKWKLVRQVRRVVTGAIEVERTAKTIGASLEAAPIVHIVDEIIYSAFKDINFADICITSKLEKKQYPLKEYTSTIPKDAFKLPEVEYIAVSFAKAEGEKCMRCWKILDDVGTHKHPQTCERCNQVLEDND